MTAIVNLTKHALLIKTSKMTGAFLIFRKSSYFVMHVTKVTICPAITLWWCTNQKVSNRIAVKPYIKSPLL